VAPRRPLGICHCRLHSVGFEGAEERCRDTSPAQASEKDSSVELAALLAAFLAAFRSADEAAVAHDRLGTSLGAPRDRLD
jgi:hypothetical protein